jgi:hypothetical protein
MTIAEEKNPLSRLERNLINLRQHLSKVDDHKDLTLTETRPKPSAVKSFFGHVEEAVCLLFPTLILPAALTPHIGEPTQIIEQIHSPEPSRFMTLWRESFVGMHEIHDALEFIETVRRRRWLTGEEEAALNLYSQILAKAASPPKQPTSIEAYHSWLSQLDADLGKAKAALAQSRAEKKEGSMAMEPKLPPLPT